MSENVCFVGPRGPDYNHFFTLIISKYTNKHHIKKTEEFIHWTNFQVRKNGKMAKKGPFFGPGGPNFDPFFTIFCKSLLNMPKKIIFKNQKNSFTRKNSKSEKWENGKKKAVFWPWRAEF